MKLTFITMYYPPERGAPVRRAEHITCALTGAGHKVRVVTHLPNYPKGELQAGIKRRLLCRDKMFGAHITRVLPLLFKDRTTAKRTLGELWFMAWSGVCAAWGPKPDAVLATCPSVFSPFAGFFASRVRRSRFILEVRDLIWHYPAAIEGKESRFAPLIEKGIMWVARRADLLVFTNRQQAEYFVERGVSADRCEVVTNGVDAALLEQMAASHSDETGFHAMYLGLVGRPQGLHVLVEAARLLDDDPRYKITVVGDGLELDDLRARAEGYGLKNLEFFGSVPADKVVEQYRRANILVAHLRAHPVFESALPSKLFEYMACKKPVVYGGRGAGADLVQEANGGIVVAPESPEELAAAIRRLAEDPELARTLAANGYRHVAENYRRELVLARMLEAFQRLAPPAKSARAGLAAGEGSSSA
jgi:glycosyltransferase involved in cell wall biosynthesis